MRKFIDVILPLPISQLFTYAVAADEYDFLCEGMRVAVPFGRVKVYTGLVFCKHENPPTAYEAKPILAILDAKPIVTNKQLLHWQWISEYYMCSMGAVFKSALPAAYLLEGASYVVINKDKSVENYKTDLNDTAYIVLEALASGQMLIVQTLTSLLPSKQLYTTLDLLLKFNLVNIEESLTAKYTPKFRNEYVLKLFSIDPTYINSIKVLLKNAPKQLSLYLWFHDNYLKKELVTDQLLKLHGFGVSSLKALEEKNLILKKTVRVDRVNFDSTTVLAPLKQLNPDQTEALKQIKNSFFKEKVSLLQGVTASGKTEVYVSLIKNALDAGKQVLYLLPEIALTTQLIGRLQSYFGETVGVYHSKYNIQERVEVWQQVLQGKSKAQLVVGARSSLFLPFKNLGLIVVDEEHEASFKQYDPAPRYHARDAAVVLAKISKASIVLGSATPSLESLHNVHIGKYDLASLLKRHAQIQMPDIQLVDLKEQYKKKKMKLHFSEPLRQRIQEALEAGEQVILFQNRRGYAPVVECFTCGHSPQCNACDVTLTFHARGNVLRCHYCGYEQPKTVHCSSCGSLEIDTKGFGTEQIEEALGTLFPKAKVGRMDLDTTRAKNGYQKLIDSFEQQEIQILVGTQMLSKGLDFRNVSLVGVLSADSMLNYPDFRAHEKTFQLLTQVAGRAGRTAKRGLVLIQSFNPLHEILQQVTQHDYTGMSKEQLYQREVYKYPPFNKLVKITFKHKDYNKVNEASEWFAKGLRSIFVSGVLGPEFPAVARIRNLYLKNILLKIPPHISSVAAKKSILRLENSFEAIGSFKGVRLIFVVDPI